MVTRFFQASFSCHGLLISSSQKVGFSYCCCRAVQLSIFIPGFHYWLCLHKSITWSFPWCQLFYKMISGFLYDLSRILVSASCVGESWPEHCGVKSGLHSLYSCITSHREMKPEYILRLLKARTRDHKIFAKILSSSLVTHLTEDDMVLYILTSRGWSKSIQYLLVGEAHSTWDFWSQILQNWPQTVKFRWRIWVI